MTREEYVDFANALKNNYTIDFDKLPEFCDMAISLLKENKGEWLDETPEEDVLPIYTCSECGMSNLWESPFCPSCGVDMRDKRCRCNTCKNNDDEFSGECYECLKGMFDHYEAESEEDFPRVKDIFLGNNPDRIRAIEEAMNEAIKEKAEKGDE